MEANIHRYVVLMNHQELPIGTYITANTDLHKIGKTSITNL